MTQDDIRQALEPFGATLNAQGFITKGANVTKVKPVMQGGRLRFESDEAALLASGRPNAEFVAHFVGRFWFWTKKGTP
jgi:hypothetical protein